MEQIQSPAYLTNPFCQAFENIKRTLNEEWRTRAQSNQGDSQLREAHRARYIEAEALRDHCLLAEGLKVEEHWGYGEDNNYYVDLAPIGAAGAAQSEA